MHYESTIGEQTCSVYIDHEHSLAEIKGTKIPYNLIYQDDGKILLRTGTKLFKIDNITVDEQRVSFSINGRFVETTIKDEQDLLLEKLGFKTNASGTAGLLLAPMPGLILELLVKEGDKIEAGQPVIILEAMKMENELKAPVTGTVASVHISPNDSVEKNQPLIEIKPCG